MYIFVSCSMNFFSIYVIMKLKKVFKNHVSKILCNNRVVTKISRFQVGGESNR